MRYRGNNNEIYFRINLPRRRSDERERFTESPLIQSKVKRLFDLGIYGRNQNKNKKRRRDIKKNNIPLKELDNMISVREKQQDHVSQEDSIKIEADIEKIMEYIDAHYDWCPNCSSYFEGYRGFKKNIKLYGEHLCNACIKRIKQNIKTL